MDVFVTGMYLMKEYGYTIEEIRKLESNAYLNLKPKLNYNNRVRMDIIFSKTIDGFSKYVKTNKPDLIMLHGMIRGLAGAVVGAYNNILVGHIEGGSIWHSRQPMKIQYQNLATYISYNISQKSLFNWEN